MSDKQKPVRVYRSGRIKAAIWQNESVDQDSGEITIRHSVTLAKSWKPKDKDWQEASITFFPDELPVVCQVLTQLFGDTFVKMEIPE